MTNLFRFPFLRVCSRQIRTFYEHVPIRVLLHGDPSLKIDEYNRTRKPSSVEKIAAVKQHYAIFSMKDRAAARVHNTGRQNKRQKIAAPPEPGTNEDVLRLDIENLLALSRRRRSQSGADDVPRIEQPEILPELYTEIELKIQSLSSTGDGLALSESGNHAYVVPFSVPGDTVRARVYHQKPSLSHSLTDFIKVVKPSAQRDDSYSKCKYFAKCAGCQLQMLPYAEQLLHKKMIVENAFKNYSELDGSLIPAVRDTMGSPLEYGYRTKLTPHFDRTAKGGFDSVPDIGFSEKNRKYVMDIEECPIGTEILNKGLARERARIARDFATFKRGATILLRETTERKPSTDTMRRKSKILFAGETSKEVGRSAETRSDGSLTPERAVDRPQPGQIEDVVIRNHFPDYTEEKRCVSDMRGTSTEYVEDYRFENQAGSFFQNNNSILPLVTQYIRDNAYPSDNDSEEKPIKYLLDAYCGSGLFTVTLSSKFSSSLGVDVDGRSIAAARKNAANNNVDNAGFVESDAADIFYGIPFPPEQTVLIIDPPRKGCGDDFLKQLLTFGPKRVIYVSCNVHTQARDVGVLVNGQQPWRYEIESIRGFDFFPQTGHVEGVAVLNRKWFWPTDRTDGSA